ncbi:uncharacterized protein AKAW2_11899A [Aspergillus luchuensis]|uniref:Uncharacterized protein n=1 Tax=Aspergillus kawachii TaxID=1069201 RepID=A0A7R7W2N4_ASPKA|nr:uncharacterized protein AKAW2_11899A [Aspergillus luchuensis]BCR94853.1 hypothetical protein AKAW2_11899A [Aspergillus luchuensis]
MTTCTAPINKKSRYHLTTICTYVRCKVPYDGKFVRTKGKGDNRRIKQTIKGQMVTNDFIRGLYYIMDKRKPRERYPTKKGDSTSEEHKATPERSSIESPLLQTIFDMKDAPTQKFTLNHREF